MSRIGKKPIPVPASVEVSLTEGNLATVKGPKGTLVQQLPPMITFEKDGAVIHAKRQNDSKEHRSQHGLGRTLLDNMIVGVTSGFTKQLEVNGVGYRAAVQNGQLVHSFCLDTKRTKKIKAVSSSTTHKQLVR